MKRTTASSEPDPFEDSLSDLVRNAQRDLDGAPRMQEFGFLDGGELVERSDSVSFVLTAAGYRLKDFRVSVGRGRLRAEAPDFELSRPLGCAVESAGVKAEYRNGVLSVRLPKKF